MSSERENLDTQRRQLEDAQGKDLVMWGGRDRSATDAHRGTPRLPAASGSWGRRGGSSPAGFRLSAWQHLDSELQTFRAVREQRSTIHPVPRQETWVSPPVREEPTRRPLVELCVEPAGLCGRCTGVAVPLRAGTPSRQNRGIDPPVAIRRGEGAQM